MKKTPQQCLEDILDAREAEAKARSQRYEAESYLVQLLVQMRRADLLKPNMGAIHRALRSGQFE
jgi:hypothetical protein